MKNNVIIEYSIDSICTNLPIAGAFSVSEYHKINKTKIEHDAMIIARKLQRLLFNKSKLLKTV